LDLFMEALNVSIYGLGIVFLTLLVLMFAIMVLSKIFSVATGKEIMVAPGVASARSAAPQAAPPAVAQATAPEAVAAHAPPLHSGSAIPEMAAAPVAAEVVAAVHQITAPLPGKVLSVTVTAGAAVRRGDELCVIEAMKMGNSIKAEMDGIVREVLVAPGQSVGFGAPLVTIATAAAAQPSAAAPAPSAQPAPTSAPAPAPMAAAQPAAPAAPSSFRLGVGDKQHKVAIEGAGSGQPIVKVDGKDYRVERDQADRRRVIVNGTPYTVEVKEVSGNQATVVIDGQTRRVDIAAVGPPASYRLASGQKSYDVQISDPASSDPTVSVGGTSYEVKRDKERIVVNGKPHVVEVKEVSGDRVTVTIDGMTRVVQVGRADAPAPPSPAPAPSPSPYSAPAAQPAPAAAQPAAPPPPPQPAAPPPPQPAPAAPAAQPAPSAAAEAITAPLPGKILTVAVKPGDGVSRGDELCVIEAMKMGNSIRAQRNGTVSEVLVAPGQTVSFGTTLLLLN
jgi:glutaconyl-CoA/methylmalonyl-CoA decarboxylase subunit gamma